MSFESLCISCTLCSVYHMDHFFMDDSNEDHWCNYAGAIIPLYPYNFPYFIPLEAMNNR